MQIRQITFLKILLVMPLLSAFLISFKVNAVGAILLLSLKIGGVPYIVFAALIFFGLNRMRSGAQVHKLICLSPILFLPILIIGYYASVLIERAKGVNVQFAAGDMLPLVVFGLLVGYAFVILTEVLFAICKSIGWVAETWSRAEQGL